MSSAVEYDDAAVRGLDPSISDADCTLGGLEMAVYIDRFCDWITLRTIDEDTEQEGVSNGTENVKEGSGPFNWAGLKLGLGIFGGVAILAVIAAIVFIVVLK